MLLEAGICLDLQGSLTAPQTSRCSKKGGYRRERKGKKMGGERRKGKKKSEYEGSLSLPVEGVEDPDSGDGYILLTIILTFNYNNNNICIHCYYDTHLYWVGQQKKTRVQTVLKFGDKSYSRWETVHYDTQNAFLMTYTVASKLQKRCVFLAHLAHINNKVKNRYKKQP